MSKGNAMLTSLVARTRLLSVRRRSLARIAAAACIVAGAWTGWSTFGSLAARRDAWGTRVPVVVADVELSPGDPADGSTMSLRSWPAALVPAGALSQVPDAVVRQRVGPGELVGALDVGTGRGPSGLVPDGWAAVAIAIEAGRRPPLAVGDDVGLIVGGARRADGVVVTIDLTAVVVALPADRAGPVAAAALDDAVGIVLDGG
jgi:hypothetical protein